MANLVLSSITDDQVNEVLIYLKETNQLTSDVCQFCKEKKGEIGGFLPVKDKIGVYCDNPVCRVRAYYKIMKRNGYGSPEFSV